MILPGRMSAERMEVSTFGYFQTNTVLLKKASSEDLSSLLKDLRFFRFYFLSLFLGLIPFANRHTDVCTVIKDWLPYAISFFDMVEANF